MKSCVFAWSLAGLLAVAAAAQDAPAKAEDKPDYKPKASLKVGDKAPPLTVGKWLKGQPVKEFEKGKYYVVEYWATWCVPCIQSMPHLTDIQKEYKSKGLTIIGMTSVDKNGNTLEKAEAMVKDKGDDDMGYTVAWDQDRTTNDAYMQAAGRNTIPCSFVIDGDGKIAWIGHPAWLDYVLEPLVAAKWDSKVADKLNEGEKRQIAIYRAAQADPKEALSAFQILEKDYPKVTQSMSDVKLGLLLQVGEYDAVYKVWGEKVDTAIAKKDPMTLNQIAWTIVDPDGKLAKKDLDLAMKAATKADEFTKGEDGAIIDTLARVYFLKGNVDKAIELQTKAVAAATESMKAELKKTLDEYTQSKKKND